MSHDQIVRVERSEGEGGREERMGGRERRKEGREEEGGRQGRI